MKLPIAYIPSPSSNGLSVGPLFFHVYGIMYVLAVAAAIAIARRRWTAMGGDGELVYEAARWGFPAGLIGGRIYFDITTPSQMPDHWWGPFAIWDGGLGIWGGVAAGVLVGVWRLRRHLSWPQIRQMMDAAAPGLIVAQAIGRIGNYFNQELYGKPSTLPWAVRISQPHWPTNYSVPARFRLPGGYATFQPSFLYEMIFDLAWAGLLIWLGRRGRVKAPGLFALYVAGYCAYRIFEEQIRIDYSNYILGMRLNFWVALIGALAALAWFVRIQTRRGRNVTDGEPAPAARSTAGYSRSGSG